MGKSHHHKPNHSHGRPVSEKKALRHVEEARSSYARAENRLASLRVRLQRAEDKLVRRTTRLGRAEEALAALAHEGNDAGVTEGNDAGVAEPAATGDGRAPAAAGSAAPTPAQAADDLVAAIPIGEPLTPAQAGNELAHVGPGVADGNGAKPRRSRARRPSSTIDEA